jgi:hypothetical protein
MLSDMNLIKNLESFGDLYCRRYLDLWENEGIRTNWWIGLRFFLNHAFMRGRRDQLSEAYYTFTADALRQYFGISDKPAADDFSRLTAGHENFIRFRQTILEFKKRTGVKQSLNAIADSRFETEVASSSDLIGVLTRKARGVRSLNNDKDLLMVLSALAFLSGSGMPENIYLFILEKMRTGEDDKIKALIESIYAIGDKISTFILRDIALMNPELPVADKTYVFPVDTWVSQNALSIGCASGEASEVRRFFIEKAEATGSNVAKIAAGLWYMGFHSRDILIEGLRKHNFYKQDIRVCE